MMTPDTFPHSSAQRYASHHTGGYGIKFIRVSISRVGASGPGHFQDTCQPYKHGFDDKYSDDHLADIYTGYLGRFRIAAHDINVLPKHSLVEQRNQTPTMAMTAMTTKRKSGQIP